MQMPFTFLVHSEDIVGALPVAAGLVFAGAAAAAVVRHINPLRRVGPVLFRTRLRLALYRRRQHLHLHPMAVVLLVAVPALIATLFLDKNLKLASSSLGFGRTVEGKVTHVRDGDTIEVSGIPIRFAKLDCAERGTLAGDRATRRMATIARGRIASCTLNGRRSYDREIGSCSVSGRDLADRMVQDGYCGRW